MRLAIQNSAKKGGTRALNTFISTWALRLLERSAPSVEKESAAQLPSPGFLSIADGWLARADDCGSGGRILAQESAGEDYLLAATIKLGFHDSRVHNNLNI
jgi:hypothetical protein